jgi:hypothetical protein
MKRFKKKPLIISLIAIAAAVGITTGVVFAQDETDTQPEAQHGALLEKVCEIYEDNTGDAIDPEALKDAFIAAQGEMMAEAVESYLDKLVEEGVITQEEAEQIKEWWETRPDTPLSQGSMFRFRGGAGGPVGRFGPQLGGFGFPGGQGLPDDGASETSSTY